MAASLHSSKTIVIPQTGQFLRQRQRSFIRCHQL